MAKFIISPEKIYNIPSEISITNVDGKILIIAPETANWIVLESPYELEIFEAFRSGMNISEIMSGFPDYIHETRNVVTQLEGRSFCNRAVSSATATSKGLHFYLTNKCNLSCPHCYMFSSIPEEFEVSTDEVLQFLNAYKENGGVNVTFSGGEPTVRPDFETIVLYASHIGLKTRILTNGMLWDSEKIKRISPYIDSIQISIDGFNEESNSKIRGRGHFQRAIETIEYFVRRGTNTSVAITPPLSLLTTHLDDYCVFALKLADKYRGCKFLIKFSEGLLNGRDVCPSKETNDLYFSLMQQLQMQFHGSDYEVKSFARAYRNNIIMDNCMFGIFSVASNGDVYLCARIHDLKPVANIRTHTFAQIDEISHKAEQATLISNLRPCSNCDLRYICGGGCRIDEFNGIVNRDNFDEVDFEMIAPRKCDIKMREKFYRLMVKANTYLMEYPKQ